MCKFRSAVAVAVCMFASAAAIATAQETDVGGAPALTGTASISGRMYAVQGGPQTEPILVIPASAVRPIALEAYAPEGDPDRIEQAGSERSGPGFVRPDSAGNYRVNDLAPGEYLVLATTLVVFDPPPPEEVNVSVLDITFAARGYRVSAAADQSVGGVDFILAEAIDQPKPREPTLPISADVISTDASLTAQFVEDEDGDGRLSSGDTSPGVSTLVILVPMRGDQFVLQPEDVSNLAQVNLFSAEDGSFSFTNIPSGAYQLLLYWSAGFVELPARPTIPHLAVAAVRVDAQGVVTSAVPKTILLKPRPSGATPYPIGAGGAAAVPTGTVDVRAALGDRAPTPLPAASKSDGLDNTMLFAIVGGGLLGLAAIGGVALARRRARS